MTSKTLILIDGHALAYRMYFALERTGMKTTTGRPTWAVYGFFKAILDLLKNVKPDAIAVSFDCGRETFRTKEYSEYKANRSSMPDPLRAQMEAICQGVKALDIPIYSLPGFEADDVIGTITREAKEQGHKCLILTGDQDSFQLLDDEEDIKVLIPSKGELIEYNPAKVHEKLGVYPNQLIDYKGLRGDTSDNIPGVKGVGEKTAVKLIEQFGTVENIYERIDEVSSASLKEKLITSKEMAVMSKYLATINREVPIDFDFEHTHLTMPDLEVLTNFLKENELTSLIKQLPILLKPFNNGNEVVIPDELSSYTAQKPQPKPEGQMQLGLGLGIEPQTEHPLEEDGVQEVLGGIPLNFHIVDTKEKLSNLVDILNSVKVFSIDTETTGIDVFNADLVGISISYDKNIRVEGKKLIGNVSDVESIYIPVGHSEGVQLDLNIVIDALKPILESKDIYKVLQNAKYDLNILDRYGVCLKGILLDTMIASYVISPTAKHGLKQQASYILKYDMKQIEELIGKGKSSITMDKVPLYEAAEYACADSHVTFELAKYYSDRFDDAQSDIVFNIEMPLIDVLANIEKNGVSVDLEYLRKLSSELGTSIAEIEKQIFEYAGMRFNVNSPKQVSDVLFGTLKLDSKAKTKTGFSTNAKVLESLANKHPIVKLLLEHRHLSKLLSTYIDTLPELINSRTGRIHTSFNQTVTTTGRLSSSNPNLQNIPIRTEIGNSIRAAFVPADKENSVVFSADYSQIELRLLAHFSRDPVLTEAFKNNTDIHTVTASRVFNVPEAEVTKEMRRQAKAVNFGIIYGQSSYGLAEGLGISPSDAKKIIDKYFDTYPNIRAYMQSTVQSAYETGCVTTLYGRKRYLGDELNSRNKSIREFAQRAAINAPLQGTAADLIKLAMIRLYKELCNKNFKSKIILQVHDELVLEVPKEELVDVSELVKTCMELGQPLTVPLVVDMAAGESWMET